MDRKTQEKNVASSSIVDLKAELYRKQLEYQHLKSASGFLEGSYIAGRKTVKKPTIWSKKNSGVQKRIKADENTSTKTTTDSDRLEASRQALEVKAKLYDRLAQDGDNAEDEDGQSLYLVDFEKKFIDKTMESRERLVNKEQEVNNRGDDTNSADLTAPDSVPEEDQWVDYTDSLGRSRRCMKKDLPAIKALDKSINPAKLLSGRQSVDSCSQSTDQEPDLCSADMRREMLREKWEREQREMLENQETVHYANVQYDEQRAHGVGYYQFSKDEEERKKELEKLNKLREETKANRAAKERLKDKRKQLLDARLEKVRQRRIAQGKPVPELKVNSDSNSDDELIGPPAPKEMKQETRPDSASIEIREWDRGKPGLLIPQRPKKPKGWVNPRDKRDEEFAPPSFYYNQSASVTNANDKLTSGGVHQTSSQTVTSSTQIDSLYTYHELSNKDSTIENSSQPTENVSNIPLPTDCTTNSNAISSSIDQMLQSLRKQS